MEHFNLSEVFFFEKKIKGIRKHSIRRELRLEVKKRSPPSTVQKPHLHPDSNKQILQKLKTFMKQQEIATLRY